MSVVPECMNVCTTCMPGAHRRQKRTPDLLEELELWVLVNHFCGFWELNLGPLQEQQFLLTIELSPQLLFSSFLFFFFKISSTTHL